MQCVHSFLHYHARKRLWSLSLIKRRAMEIKLHAFFNSALAKPGLSPRKEPQVSIEQERG